MITDLVLSMIHAIYAGLLALLPVMGDRPVWIDHVYTIMGYVNLLLPVDMIQAFMPTIIATLGLLVAYRILRLLLPGG